MTSWLGPACFDRQMRTCIGVGREWVVHPGPQPAPVRVHVESSKFHSTRDVSVAPEDLLQVSLLVALPKYFAGCFWKQNSGGARGVFYGWIHLVVSSL